MVYAKYAEKFGSQTDKADAFLKMVAEGTKAAAISPRPQYDAAVVYNDKGYGSKPNLKPYSNADIGKLAKLVLTYPHYRLTDAQSARLEITKNGWYYLGSIFVSNNGVPANLLPQENTPGLSQKNKLPDASGKFLPTTGPNANGATPTGPGAAVGIGAAAAAIWFLA